MVDYKYLAIKAKELTDNYFLESNNVKSTDSWEDIYNKNLVQLAIAEHTTNVLSESKALKCEIVEADFIENTIKVEIEETDFVVHAGSKYLCDFPPVFNKMVRLTEMEVDKVGNAFLDNFEYANLIIDAYEKKNKIS